VNVNAKHPKSSSSRTGHFDVLARLRDFRGSGARSSRRRPLTVLSAVVLFLLVLAPAAHAGRVPGFGELGTGVNGAAAGQLGTSPQGVAVNTSGAGGVAKGDVYVSDATNNRISQFSGSGAFIRAFGLNVVTSGPDNATPSNAKQAIEVPASVTGGTFKLGYNGASTGGTGTGTLTEGSSAVTNLVTAQGTGNLVAGSFTVSAVTTSNGQFIVGQPVSGEGIPTGAIITHVEGGSLTLSAAANAEGTGVTLTSAGPLPFTVGEQVSGAGIPAGTTITAASAGSLTLSAPVESGGSGQAVPLSADLPFDASAATVQAALTSLGTIGAGNATVSGGPGGTAPFAVTFAGVLKEAPVPAITADSSGLSGGTVDVTDTTAGVSPYEICDVEANPTDVCAKGTAGGTAGAVAGAQGLTVDPATGNVFLASNTNKRIDVFSAKGEFEGSFGWKVNASAPAEELQFCTFATGCKAGTGGGAAGQIGSPLNGGTAPAISPVDGHLFLPDPGNRRVDEYSLSLDGSQEVIGASFVEAFGPNVAPAINEQQEVSVSGATGGTFALELEGKSTDVSGSGNVEAGSNEISKVSTSGNAFSRGEEVFGPGIPAGTKITVVTFDSLTLSAAATATTAGASIRAALPYDAEAFAIRTALEAVPTVGTENVTVTGPAGGPWTVEFIKGLEGEPVDLLSGDASGLTGTSPAVGVKRLRKGANGPNPGIVIYGAAPPVLETCTVATTCAAGDAQGTGKEGTFVRNTPTSVAIDSTGAIYVAGQPGGKCEGACGVLKFNPEGKEPQEFAPAQLTPVEAANPAGNSVRFVAVDPSNDRVEVLKNVSESGFKLFEFSRAGGFIEASPPAPGGAAFKPTGFAVGTQERSYVVVGSGAAVKILGVPPAPAATVEPAGEVTANSAVLAGLAEPSGPGVEGGFPTVAYFEYSTDGVTWTSTEPIEIGTGTGSGDPSSCPTGNPPACSVSQKITGLASGQGYLARLVVSNGTTTRSPTVSFETISNAPAVSGMASRSVTESSATLQGEVNPNNRSTTYHFEWGLDTNYGTRVPAEFDAVAGSGGKPVAVSASISGLQPNTTYHFRIVAQSSGGTTLGPDTTLTTLNTAGLSDNRRAELVSPADKRPSGSVQIFAPLGVNFEAAEDGEHDAFPVMNGIAGSTAGGEVIYSTQRTAGGWGGLDQLTPPSLVPTNSVETGVSGRVKYLSPSNFKCAVVESQNPLTADTPAIDRENNIGNLYRLDTATNTYTLITNRVPLNPSIQPIAGFFVAGANADCTKVFFRENQPNFEYLPGGTSFLYEWDNGTLRDAGLLPDGSVGKGTTFGSVGEETVTNQWSVSPGGRLFFTANSNEGKDSGTRAVFVRNGAGNVVDASEPTTSTPTLGANYETASPDGSHVFFRAAYGLTPESSSGGTSTCTAVPASNPTDLSNFSCDLYDYDVATGELTDITADTNPADTNGAVAQGIAAVSKDGSTVYFAARGQLVPGQGPTYSQNLQGVGQASVYRWHDGNVQFVGTVGEEDLSHNASQNGFLIRNASNWVSQTTNDGGYFYFVSTVNATGQNPTGLPAAYLYTASSESLECVSCPGEGKVPHTYPAEPFSGVQMLPRQMTEGAGYDNYHPRSLGGGGRAFFNSYDALTSGAVAGELNVYESYRGQLSLLATHGAELRDVAGPNGRDVFLNTYSQLAPQDTDFSSDVYDLRAGGGFPPPAAAPAPCNPENGECQGPVSPAPAAPDASSAGFVGPGNPPVEKPSQKKKKHKKKKHHKKHAKHKRHHKKKHKNKKHPHKPRHHQHQQRKGKGRAQSLSVESNRGGVK
jgi:hypothetical protein